MKQLMDMLIYKLTSLLTICFFSAVVYAEESIDIRSVSSSEGVSLSCSSELITLNIYSETQKVEISASRKNNLIYLANHVMKYDNLLTAETSSDLLCAYESVSYSYFDQAIPISGPAVTTEEKEQAISTYQLLNKALQEAHSGSKCLMWDL